MDFKLLHNQDLHSDVCGDRQSWKKSHDKVLAVFCTNY